MKQAAQIPRGNNSNHAPSLSRENGTQVFSRSIRLEISGLGGPGTGRRAYADDKVVGETGRHSERRMFTLKIV